MKISFLSFKHWSEHPSSRVRSGKDSLLQSIELARAAEEIGIAGASFRVHHFADQQSSPFPCWRRSRRRPRGSRWAPP